MDLTWEKAEIAAGHQYSYVVCLKQDGAARLPANLADLRAGYADGGKPAKLLAVHVTVGGDRYSMPAMDDQVARLPERTMAPAAGGAGPTGAAFSAQLAVEVLADAGLAIWDEPGQAAAGAEECHAVPADKDSQIGPDPGVLLWSPDFRGPCAGCTAQDQAPDHYYALVGAGLTVSTAAGGHSESAPTGTCLDSEITYTEAGHFG